MGSKGWKWAALLISHVRLACWSRAAHRPLHKEFKIEQQLANQVVHDNGNPQATPVAFLPICVLPSAYVVVICFIQDHNSGSVTTDRSRRGALFLQKISQANSSRLNASKPRSCRQSVANLRRNIVEACACTGLLH